jgi:hypothetical protein
MFKIEKIATVHQENVELTTKWRRRPVCMTNKRRKSAALISTGKTTGGNAGRVSGLVPTRLHHLYGKCTVSLKSLSTLLEETVAIAIKI